jgi:phospholipase C
MSSSSSLFGQIEHVVLLMLENRSFDQMLGFLYADQKNVSPLGQPVAPDNSAGQYGFNFQRFGLRVPTLLVSPLIQAGTVFRTASQTPFDHTSVLATLENRFGVVPLTKRDAAAPELSSVLTWAEPRTDDPLQGVEPPQSQAAPRLPVRPSHLEEALANTAELLPVADLPGAGYHSEQPNLRTGRRAIEYARKRFEDYANTRK